jgi:hypothetical protein
LHNKFDPHARKYLQYGLLGAVAILFGTARIVPGTQHSGPVLTAAVSLVTASASARDSVSPNSVSSKVTSALTAFQNIVRPLSDERALPDAFRGYFAYKTAHPEDVRKPYLYFVDYGLPSTEPRGYVFDMDSLEIVDGPFTVAHGRGSSTTKYGVPTRFSNASGSLQLLSGSTSRKIRTDFAAKQAAGRTAPSGSGSRVCQEISTTTHAHEKL